MYRDGDVTPYGQTLADCTVQQCWDECLKLSDYYARRDRVDEFNRKNKHVKRGISINPCQFGIAYTAVHLNQGAAIVHIYRDGSVLITHGGVEIGQGLHTKLLQVATRELGIEAKKIHISETSTDKVPNGTPTSASCGSDLFGMAVMLACQELKKRLAPYKKTHADSWENVVLAAYLDRISLSATGFYKTPKIGWNSEKIGSPFNYYSTGAACTEVELDCLTGHHKILRTDIVMDIGQSLNPAIDIGQIEGAYAFGIGLFTSEELVFNEQGKLLTAGPNSYKIPTFGSIPAEFNVSILPGSSNPHAIYSSKAIGEPPLLLATSVFYAIKDSIRAYRRTTGKTSDFRLDSPATAEKILIALLQN
jgi:xanthine dehydrogenase/oxidase